jgi:uncharacterized protein (DUF1697 family)
MASIIFFRAVNVGGHQKFQPGRLAAELAALGVVNIGAAGTFVVRKAPGQATLRAEIFSRLHFQPELMICPAREVTGLLESEPFRDAPAGKDITQYVCVMAKTPVAPPLPLDFPAAGPWEVKVHRVVGRFVCCLQRPGQKKLYPNAVVERHFGVSATTRNWNTFLKIGGALEK